MEVGELNYSLISSPYDSFMRKHLQHYGYFSGRGEVIKKYGFLPSKPQLISSSSDSESSSDEDAHAKYKAKSFAPDVRIPIRPARFPYGSNGRGPNDECSFEARWPIEVEVLNEPRIKHLDTSPKEPELFHKSTMDRGPMARSYDENNGRVVFNYSPDSCGYFLRSRIGGNREGCRPAAAPLRSPDDTTVLFESRFESGNLMKAVQVGEFDYELYLRYDLYTKRNTQWFYFRLQNIRADKRYRFTIVNFFKPTSLYSCGMKPLMYSVNDAENKNIGWRRWGEEIAYYRNNLTAPDNSYVNLYSLTWTCKFPNDNDTYYFAHCYPYTYSDLQEYLNEVQGDRFKSQYCKQKVLCRTLAGNFIYMLTITNPSTVHINNSSTPADQQLKKGVVVTARVHPGETNSSWMMKGLLDFLLGDSADAKLLRDNFVFKIIPMLNPDGVIVGNYRCSLSGRDLNRNYKTILKDAYPSIWHTREMIKRFMNEMEVVLYCDFHGHSRKQNVFFYGCENKHLPNEKLKERIFPAMLSKNDPSKFSYYSSKFKVQKHKEGTGRVVMWSLGILNSYTLEATFCGSTQAHRAGHHFNTKDLESIGYHFLDSLLDYCDPDHTKRNKLLRELEDNLRHSIQIKLLQRGVNPAALVDIDLDQFSSEDDSSDDVGSDSSADDGLPKHLEVIAAAKVRLKKTRKKVPAGKATTKDGKRKDEIDKENLEKNKGVGLSLSKARNPQFPNIDLLNTQDNNTGIVSENDIDDKQKARRHRSFATYRVCKCFACLNKYLFRNELPLMGDLSKPMPPLSSRRTQDASSDIARSESAHTRTNRWPTLSQTQISTNRINTSDEKARRSQAEYYKILSRDTQNDDRDKQIVQQPSSQVFDDDILLTSSSVFPNAQKTSENPSGQEYPVRYASLQSFQPTEVHELSLLNEPRDAFTATYLLRRLNSLERESSINVSSINYPVVTPNSRVEEETNAQEPTDDTEAENEPSRATGTNSNDDGKLLSNSFVTNRLAAQLNERLIGAARPFSSRPKSSGTALQNRSVLDIRSIQPPIIQPTPKRMSDQQQRQRMMMVFGKQSPNETVDRTSTVSTRSYHVSMNERKSDETPVNNENSASTISKLLPIQPDSMSVNLTTRYDLSVLNRSPIVRGSSVKKSGK